MMETSTKTWKEVASVGATHSIIIIQFPLKKKHLYPADAYWQNPELVCYNNWTRINVVGNGHLIIVTNRNKPNTSLDEIKLKR